VAHTGGGLLRSSEEMETRVQELKAMERKDLIQDYVQVAVCCCVLLCVAVCSNVSKRIYIRPVQVALCCSVMQCVAVCQSATDTRLCAAHARKFAHY